MAERMTAVLRRLLAGDELILAPGVAEAMTARVVAKEGFKALYMTGSGTAATRLGMPDIGLLTMTEMVDNAERISDAAGLPLIADADTGRSTCAARCAPMNAPVSRRSISKTSSGRNAAVIFPARR
jgi:2,3-dimethylmalate lyase